jgi:hypothetical protein
MPTLNILRANGDGTGLRQWTTQSFLSVDEGIAAADGLVITNNQNPSGTVSYVTTFQLNDVNGDFKNILNLSWQIRYRVIGAQTNTRNISVRIVSGGVILAALNSIGDFQDIAGRITNTSFVNSPITAFGYINTIADKSLWDNAEAEIRLTVTRSMGGDTNGIAVDTFEFTGQYEKLSLFGNVSTSSLVAGNFNAQEQWVELIYQSYIDMHPEQFAEFGSYEGTSTRVIESIKNHLRDPYVWDTFGYGSLTSEKLTDARFILFFFTRISIPTTSWRFNTSDYSASGSQLRVMVDDSTGISRTSQILTSTGTLSAKTLADNGRAHVFSITHTNPSEPDIRFPFRGVILSGTDTIRRLVNNLPRFGLYNYSVGHSYSGVGFDFSYGLMTGVCPELNFRVFYNTEFTYSIAYNNWTELKGGVIVVEDNGDMGRGIFDISNLPNLTTISGVFSLDSYESLGITINFSNCPNYIGDLSFLNWWENLYPKIRIKTLFLDNTPLLGAIDLDNIFDFRQVQGIYASNCNILGPVPDFSLFEYGVQFVYFQNNRLYGTVKSFEIKYSVVELDLSNNDLSEIEFPTLSTTFSYPYIDLSFNKLKQSFIDSFLSNLASLASLDPLYARLFAYFDQPDNQFISDAGKVDYDIIQSIIVANSYTSEVLVNYKQGTIYGEVGAVTDISGELTEAVSGGTSKIFGNSNTTSFVEGSIKGKVFLFGSSNTGSLLFGEIGGKVSIVCSIVTQTTLSAVLKATKRGTGNVVTSSILSASIVGKISASVNVTTTSTLSGDISAKAKLLGDVSTTTSIVGLLKGVKFAVGNTITTSVLSGQIKGDIVLVGAINTSSNISGDVNGVGRVQGIILTDSILSGTLVFGAVQNIVGNISCSTTITGEVKGVANLVSNISTLTILESNLSGRIQIVSSTIASTVLVGSLVGSISTVGNITSTSLLQGQLVGKIYLSSNIDTSTITLGGISGLANIISTISTNTLLVGAIVGSIYIEGDSTSTTITSASISGKIGINGVTSTTTVTQASISGLGELDSDLSTFSTLQSTINARANISTNITTSSIVNGYIQGVANLYGNTQGTTTLSGQFSSPIMFLVGSTISTTQLQGQLSGNIDIQGDTTVQSILTGTILGRLLAQSNVSTITQSSGSIQGIGRVQVNVGTSTSLSATITFVGDQSITGDSLTQSILSGILKGTSRLDTNIVTSSYVSSTLEAIGLIVGEIQTYSTLSGLLITSGSIEYIVGSITTETTVLSTIKGNVSSTGTIDTQTQLQGIVSTYARISSLVTTSSIITGDLSIKSVTKDLYGNISSSTILVGYFNTTYNIQGISSSNSRVSLKTYIYEVFAVSIVNNEVKRGILMFYNGVSWIPANLKVYRNKDWRKI